MGVGLDRSGDFGRPVEPLPRTHGVTPEQRDRGGEHRFQERSTSAAALDLLQDGVRVGDSGRRPSPRDLMPRPSG